MDVDDVEVRKSFRERRMYYRIYGIGRKFYANLGTSVFRTGAEMIIKCDYESLLQTVRANILKCCEVILMF